MGNGPSAAWHNGDVNSSYGKTKQMIELKQITKTYIKKEREVHALKNVSLKVPEGKIFGVIGASGAGKSTLIRCINLLEKPTSGEVIVNGEHLEQLSPRRLREARKNIGMIFQHFNLLSSITVFDNIALPLRLGKHRESLVQERVSSLLGIVGLSEKQHDYPASLSGGQKQRVAIARALATSPKVLLCDEATSALDPTTTRSILSLLKEINRSLKITILLITHEMEVVKNVCDEVAVLSEGRLVEQDTVGRVFSAPSSPITADFIASSIHLDVPVHYEERLNSQCSDGKYPLVRLTLSNSALDTPVLSESSRRFYIDNHIISAKVDTAGGATFGALLVEMRGNRQGTEAAIEFFNSNQIKTETLGYV